MPFQEHFTYCYQTGDAPILISDISAILTEIAGVGIGYSGQFGIGHHCFNKQ